ncbi:hypothetical protein GC584_02480 [Corynebacterium sp. zg912]|uniref:Uncharacterized protein n=1 Tax=Corynebacterium wankanglinii TaxID=2735136 RepID=A0A7H0KAL5_9CORY|nr:MULTISPECIES: hypothetical protein [Corynebacterium]MBA1836323.1 hypothetical protein [Corynebacterium wankanglinii]MCR5928318.1 hypothetical protein [Corynebacterium sp. zg912]QNP94331.1 hypothetical protein IA203_01810 [Corynebacterium wankanglinii]
MADKQLTVAELLARAEKENPEAGRRPRRRRSLEDGGVSVAELTDSFKKVEVKPAEVKHSSVPIDAPSGAPAPASTPEPAPSTPATPQPVPSTSVKLRPAEKPAAAKAQDEKPAVEKLQVVKPAAEAAKKTEKAETAKQTPATPTSKPAPAPQAKPAEGETTVLRKVEAEPVVKQASVQPDDTNEIRAVQAPEPQRAETDIFDEPAAEPEAVEDFEVEEATVNPVLLVLLVFCGVLLGVLGFLAFTWLWANTMAIVAALVGIGAVAAVVAAVGAMAAGRDKVTMVIAGLAAAVVAFGPALL